MPCLRPLVIVPTYNEAENLAPLAARLMELAPPLRLLVVDDASPDGTGAMADRLAERHPGRIEVLHRPPPQGLGRAYLAGFAHALRTDCDAILQMDADLSHPPELIPDLLRALDGADLALASRYVPGGGLRDWGWHRRLLSRAANRYAQTVLGLSIRDLTGGFKAMRRPVMEYLTTIPLDSRGYFFQIETTARAGAAGFSMTEVPFVFRERRLGISKMSGNNIGEAFWKTWKLRKALGRTLSGARSRGPA